MLKMIRLFYRRIVLSMIAIGTLLLIAARSFQGDVPEFNSLQELLLWIGTGGGAMVISGLVIAYFLENLAFWHNLPRSLKLVVPVVLTAIIGAVAQSVITLDLLTFVPPIVQTVLLMMVGWLFSQLGYRSIKEGNYAETARPENPQPTPSVPTPGPAG